MRGPHKRECVFVLLVGFKQRHSDCIHMDFLLRRRCLLRRIRTRIQILALSAFWQVRRQARATWICTSPAVIFTLLERSCCMRICMPSGCPAAQRLQDLTLTPPEGLVAAHSTKKSVKHTPLCWTLSILRTRQNTLCGTSKTPESRSWRLFARRLNGWKACLQRGRCAAPQARACLNALSSLLPMLVPTGGRKRGGRSVKALRRRQLSERTCKCHRSCAPKIAICRQNVTF